MPDSLEILVFALDAQRYALAIADIEQLVRAVAITPLPGAPKVIEGVIDVHGTLVPVLDLRARLGLVPRPLSPSDHMILARAAGRTVALRVDAATDLLRIPSAALDDAHALVGTRAPIGGVARLADGLVLVHDLNTFLASDESAALERALAAHP